MPKRKLIGLPKIKKGEKLLLISEGKGKFIVRKLGKLKK